MATNQNTLSSILKDEAVKAVTQEMRNKLASLVREREDAVEAAQASLDEAKTALDLFNQTFNTPEVKREVQYFHRESRTDRSKSGHFIKVESDRKQFGRPLGNIVYSCTCEAGQRGRTCWAVNETRLDLNAGRLTNSISEAQYSLRHSPSYPSAYRLGRY